MLSVLYVPFYNKKLQRRTILDIFYLYVKRKKKKIYYRKESFYNFRQFMYTIMY